MFKIKQIVPSGFCLRCDGCCRFSQLDTIWQPHLLNEEQKKLSKKVYLIPNIQQGNFMCVSFNHKTHKCKIYARCPFECQLYPFLISRKGKNIFLAVDLKCPFVQENLKTKKFQEYLQYLTNVFGRTRYKKSLKDNPQLIQNYPGLINLVELKF